MEKKFFLAIALLVTLGLCVLLPSSFAQQADATVPVEEAESAESAPTAPVPAPDPNVPFRQSLFFSPVEIVAIQAAMLGKVSGVAGAAAQAAGGLPIPEKRPIRVAGVFYRNPNDWIVWINGKKVTPKNLLPEIVEIDVFPDSRVRMKWFDIGLNNVLSITLRPHQTYDIVTGVLLPGG